MCNQHMSLEDEFVLIVAVAGGGAVVVMGM